MNCYYIEKVLALHKMQKICSQLHVVVYCVDVYNPGL